MSKTIRKKAEEAAKQFFPKSTFASVILVGFVVLVFVEVFHLFVFYGKPISVPSRNQFCLLLTYNALLVEIWST